LPTLDTMKGYKMQNTTAATTDQITDVLIAAGFTYKGKNYGEGFDVWDSTRSEWPSRERFGNPNAIDTMTVTRYVTYYGSQGWTADRIVCDRKIDLMSIALTESGIDHEVVGSWTGKSIQIVLSKTVIEKDNA